MRGCLAIVALGMWACLGAINSAGAAGCPSPREAQVTPNITVQAVSASPKYIYNVGRNQLTRMSGQANNGTNHGTTLGLTMSSYAPATGAYMAKWVRNGNGYCHYLKNMNMKLVLADLIVYIASEYRQGTCQAQVITTHENEHVRVHQSVLQKYAPIMREALLRHAGSAFVGPTADSQTAINRVIGPTIDAVLSQMINEQRRGNGTIDTQDSYKRTAQRCKQW